MGHARRKCTGSTECEDVFECTISELSNIYKDLLKQ